jgi:hypothetical protein
MSTQPTATDSISPVDALQHLTAVLNASQAKPVDTRDALLLSLSVVELAQRSFGAGTVSVELQRAVRSAVQSMAILPLHAIKFPVMNTLLSQTYANILVERGIIDDSDKSRVLLESLFTFLVLAQTVPAYATESTLRKIVSEATPAVVKKPAAYPEINYRANLTRIFTPGAVTAVDLEPLQVVVYMGELLGGGFGPELWGLAHFKDEMAHVLLETGEYIVVPAISLTLASTKDYATSELPPYLLACAKLYMPVLLAHIYEHNVPPELQQDLDRLDKHFGFFTQEPELDFSPAAMLAGCETVIDNARWKVDDSKAAGAVKTFSIGKSCLQIVVTAQQAAIRPYITSALIQSDTGAILMRLDTPREFSARGVYLFPLAAKSAGLIVI